MKLCKDILYEIYSHMNIIDIINFSMTCKYYNNLDYNYLIKKDYNNFIINNKLDDKENYKLNYKYNYYHPHG